MERGAHFYTRILAPCALMVSAISAGAFSSDAMAQSEDNRVLWQIEFSDDISAKEQTQIQNSVIQTLSRAKERHFVGEKILTQKVKKEGLSFPSCFEQGMPCSAGGAYILDVHNVDAYARATFSKDGSNWAIDLDLYRSFSTSATHVRKTGSSLPDVMQLIIGSLFELESSVEITTTAPDIEVYVNQKLVGTAPLNMKISVGSQHIVFKKSGYVSESWTFDAEKGKIYTHAVDLKPEETQLTVLTTADDAQIYIDDEFWAGANATKNILPGVHKLEVRSETHHDYSQEYKVYPGSPQTIQVASLPNSRSPYEIREDGIQKYRLAATVGYHLASQKLNMPDASFEGEYPSLSEKVFMHGVSMAFGYEARYWGISFLRFDIGGGPASKTFKMGKSEEAEAQNAMFVGLYPAQIRVHVPFWVMQAEASFALGYAFTKLKAENMNFGRFDLKQNAFSIDFSLGLKFYLSEESFVMLAYDLQYDAIDDSNVRNGMTIGFGFQFPVWMRSEQNHEFDYITEQDENTPSSSRLDEDIDVLPELDEFDSSNADDAPDLEDL